MDSVQYEMRALKVRRSEAGPWKEITCYGRTQASGREEIVVRGRVMVDKIEYEEKIADKAEEIRELLETLVQYKNQVIIVELFSTNGKIYLLRHSSSV